MIAPVIIALALSLSAPTLAIPLHGDVAFQGGDRVSSIHHFGQPARFPKIQRDLTSGLARRMLEHQRREPFTGSQELIARDIESLLVRGLLLARDGDESGAGIFGSLFKFLGKGFGSLLGGLGGNSDSSSSQNPPPSRRDIEELLARAASDDAESGASILDFLGSLLGGIFRRDENLPARNMEELFIRELLSARDGLDAGALLLPIDKTTRPVHPFDVSKLFARELEGVFVRELLSARQFDESGAFKFSNPFSKPVVPKVSPSPGSTVVTPPVTGTTASNPTTGGGLGSILGSVLPGVGSTLGGIGSIIQAVHPAQAAGGAPIIVMAPPAAAPAQPPPAAVAPDASTSSSSAVPVPTAPVARSLNELD
ncbi:hypothetical protein BXZ70DRAFT_909644 [Cristinia sonorae]|uniref:Uncharacterized protein n=1 Tax=Cristinia sonorae TaxID=1940300 RepID=A0A8K0UI72_9AGAR|nr:hypothetical protein BXZ70DRAFT_909644 [Cristinia sonorae]